jgi:S1-C subfamily serine protease
MNQRSIAPSRLTRSAIFVALIFLSNNVAITQPDLETEITEIVQYAEPSIVTILANIPVKGPEQKAKPLLSIFSSKPDAGNRYTLIGSGLYLNKNGYIVTRCSIVEEAMGVRVRIWNGEETHADLIGFDKGKGIALLKIDSPELPTLPYANVSSLEEGSWALVIGNSLGVSPALSMGTVSSVYKNGLIEISANIDPGANGAPVLNSEGKVVGIVSGRIAYSENDNTMLARNTVLVVPVAQIYKSSREILEEYQKNHGWIGITVHKGPYSAVTPQITEVFASSPAEKAGLKVGDVILSCNDQKFESYYSLRSIVKNAHPGDKLALVVLRGQENVSITLKVGQIEIGNLFKSVPYDSEYDYTANPNWNLNGEWSFKNRDALESRLKRMENEIKNLKKQLMFRKK